MAKKSVPSMEESCAKGSVKELENDPQELRTEALPVE